MLPVQRAAADLVRELAAARGVEPVLRVRVVGGGCAGLTWDVELGSGPRTGDHRRTTEGVTVVVDTASAAHLRGATVALGTVADNGLRTGLVSADGQAAIVVCGLLGKHVCSCGESFAAG